MKVGTADLSLTIQRTFAIWWPIALILLGLVLAVWSQGLLIQGSRGQQRWWLRRFPVRASIADAEFIKESTNWSWDAYRLEPSVREQAEQLRQVLRGLNRRRPYLLRWLPWPVGFCQAERADLSKSLAATDDLITAWPSMPAKFESAHTQLAESTSAIDRAPALRARVLEILTPETATLPVSELISRRLAIEAFAVALQVVDDLDRLVEYLDASRTLDPADTATYFRALQLQRQACAALLRNSDPVDIVKTVAPVVSRGSELASRLPAPTARATRPQDINQTKGATAVRSGAPALAVRGLTLVRHAIRRASGTTYVAGQSTLIALTVAIGVWSGLVVLYNGKAWGSPGDAIAAVAWGFGATTVISPILSSLQRLAARPSDLSTSNQA
jgi:hypothetical protein